jgi:hypothetical protein
VTGASPSAVIFETGYAEGAEAVVIVYAMRPREKFDSPRRFDPRNLRHSSTRT